MYLNIYIGILERYKNMESYFIKYLPINYPKELIKFFQEKIAITPRNGLKLFYKTYDLSYLELDPMKNPELLRISTISSYSIFTYGYNTRKTNWNFKVNSLFLNAYHIGTVLKYGDELDPDFYVSFFKKTGCLVQPTGIVVNPKFPILASAPDGITYCKGEPHLVMVHQPLNGKRHSADFIVSNYPRAKGTIEGFNKYILKGKNRFYGALQHGMSVFNLNKGFFVIYATGDKSIYCVNLTLDDNYVKTMMHRYYRSYFSEILPRLHGRFMKNKIKY